MEEADRSEIVLGNPTSSITVFCHPLRRWYWRRDVPVLIFANHQLIGTVKQGRSVTVARPKGPTQYHALSGAIAPLEMLAFYLALLRLLAYWDARHRGTLRSVWRQEFTAGLIEAPHPLLGHIIEIDCRPLAQPTENAGSPPTQAPDSLHEQQLEVVTGEAFERVVYDLPIEVAEGTTIKRTMRVFVTEGVEVKTEAQRATVNLDVKILTAIIERKTGRDLVESSTYSAEETDEVSLTGGPGGSRYRYQWVEKWQTQAVMDPATGDEVAKFQHRTEMGPRTIPD